MPRITLIEVDKKIDMLLQEVKFISKEQARVAEEFILHKKQDESHFDHLTSLGATLATDMALVKQSSANLSVFGNRMWAIATGVVTTVLGLLLGLFFPHE